MTKTKSFNQVEVKIVIRAPRIGVVVYDFKAGRRHHIVRENHTLNHYEILQRVKQYSHNHNFIER